MNTFKLSLFYLLYIAMMLYVMLLIGNHGVELIDRENTQIFNGGKALVFKHHGLTYGCLGANQRMYCDHQDWYENADFIQSKIKYIRELSCDTQNLDDSTVVQLSDGTR